MTTCNVEEDCSEDDSNEQASTPNIQKYDDDNLPKWIERKGGYTNTQTGLHTKALPPGAFVYQENIKRAEKTNAPRTTKGKGHFKDLMSATSSSPASGKKQKEKSEKTCFQRFGSYFKRLLPGGTEKTAQGAEQNTKSVNGITVYKFPLHETWRDDTNKIRKVRIGSTIDVSSEKTIQLVGATGSGKSTMIDGMINYIYGMTWQDNHRLTLVELQDDEKTKVSKADSQTEWITAYTIPKSEFSGVQDTLTIVDMPGFGDTRGIKRDKELVGQLKKLFNNGGERGIDVVNAVCFIAKAGDARLTATQRYIFEQILSIFGNDIKENIQVLITFADGKPPVVMDALKEAGVPFNKTFKFNNSALFSSINSDDQKADGGDPFIKLFWDMGMKSYSDFFEYLRHVPEKSLTLTSKVLKERDQLNVIIQDLPKNIQKAVINITNHDKLEKDLNENKESMELHQNYEIVCTENDEERVKTNPGEYVTYCSLCDYTCHAPCPHAKQEDLKECAAIDKKTGKCKVCKNHCDWSQHRSRDFYFKPTVIKIHTTLEDIKKKYHEALQGKNKLELLLVPIRKERKKLEEDVHKMVAEVTDCLTKLDKIALKKGQPSEIDYLKLLIEDEKQKCRPGYEGRVDMYKELIKQAETLRVVAGGGNVLKPKS